MISNRRIFGTDGVRSTANRYPMTPEIILKIGQAIGLHFKSRYPHPKILIGKDTRRSGYMIEQVLSSGILSVGVDSYLLGPLPTPGIAYLTRGLRANAGIVISASHNPYEDNGIKIFSGDGYKLPDEVEQHLEAMIFSEEEPFELPVGQQVGVSQRVDDSMGQYAVFLKETFPKHLTLEGLTIVLDTANGAGYKVAPKVLSELGANLILQSHSPNGTNINDGCGALHPEGLAQSVLKHKADLGIALDGDADRLIVSDEKGQLLDGDEILAICAEFYAKNNRLKSNTVVTTVMSNIGLDHSLARHKTRLLRTQVGDRYVVEKMREMDLNLGGEQSGHLIFRDSSTTGDGILAALHLLEAVLTSERSLSELRVCMQKYPQVTKSFAVPQKVPLSRLPNLEREIGKISSELGNEGQILFRYSGTEAKARVTLQGPYLNTLENFADTIQSLAQKEISQIC